MGRGRQKKGPSGRGSPESDGKRRESGKAAAAEATAKAAAKRHARGEILDKSVTTVLWCNNYTKAQYLYCGTIFTLKGKSAGPAIYSGGIFLLLSAP